MVPLPGYPLISDLAYTEGLQPVPYRLIHKQNTWEPNFDKIQLCITSNTRVIVLVSPNNPTGSILSPFSQKTLKKICQDHDLCVIADEVFRDYCFEDKMEWLKDWDDVPFIRLNGLSKTLGLPQLKLSWMIVNKHFLGRVKDALETLCDLYLSVNTWTQAAVPGLLQLRETIQSRLHDRIQANITTAFNIFGKTDLWHPLRPQGGWNLVFKPQETNKPIPSALEILQQTGVYVLDGELFDFPEKGFFVTSTLTNPDQFQEGLKRLSEI